MKRWCCLYQTSKLQILKMHTRLSLTIHFYFSKIILLDVHSMRAQLTSALLAIFPQYSGSCLYKVFNKYLSNSSITMLSFYSRPFSSTNFSLRAEHFLLQIWLPFFKLTNWPESNNDKEGNSFLKAPFYSVQLAESQSREAILICNISITHKLTHTD